MGSNSFGTLFCITTWGESHGKAIGVVIDGCPSGIALEEADIQRALDARRPGDSEYTSPREEVDSAEILSGIFEGKTTGAPISILIPNRGADSTPYEAIKDVLRPGHANFTYLEKYGCFDHRGSGRASARETACRVAAGAVAKKLLALEGIETAAFLMQVGHISAKNTSEPIEKGSLFCPDPHAVIAIKEKIALAKEAGDSLGGVVQFVAKGVPAGLGEPIYEKLEAKLAQAMMSLPASKAFEMGAGVGCVTMPGSDHNDSFVVENGTTKTTTNHSGGTLGGISNGMPVEGRVTFKPPSSISQRQKTVDLKQEETTFTLPEGAKQDPCVAIRAVPVVDAMLALVLADLLLLNKRWS